MGIGRRTEIPKEMELVTQLSEAVVCGADIQEKRAALLGICLAVSVPAVKVSRSRWR